MDEKDCNKCEQKNAESTECYECVTKGVWEAPQDIQSARTPGYKFFGARPKGDKGGGMKYRIKYWRLVNEHHGEWHRTGLMTKNSAERVAESLRKSHEQVEVYRDECE